jgi:hypothetical protein
MNRDKWTVIALMICMMASCTSSQSVDGNQTCVENPKENCVCTREYAPVCGCNNKTYGNACEAECNGITQYVKGECSEKAK